MSQNPSQSTMQLSDKTARQIFLVLAEDPKAAEALMNGDP